MKKAKVIKLYGRDSGKNPDAVLDQCVGEFNEVLIIGWDKADILEARSTTSLKKSDILFLIDTFKRDLLSGRYDDYIASDEPIA